MVTACSEVRDLDATLIVPDGVKHNFAHRFKVILCGPIRLPLLKSVYSLENNNRAF